MEDMKRKKGEGKRKRVERGIKKIYIYIIIIMLNEEKK